MSVVLRLFFSLFYISIAYANDFEIDISDNDLKEEQILELERILQIYSLQAEKGVLYKNPANEQGFILSGVSHFLSEEDRIIITELEPIQEEESYESFNELSPLLLETELQTRLNEHFKTILEKERSYLIDKSQFEDFLFFYNFLQSLKEYFDILGRLQIEIEDSFSRLNEAVSKNNEIDKKTLEIREQYNELGRRRGHLTLGEIRQVIIFNKSQGTFPSDLTLEEASNEVINDIRGIYDQIDLKKQSLEEHPLSSLLCDSSFYKQSQVNCLPIHVFRDEKKVSRFINSLSPNQWQILENRIQEQRSLNNDLIEDISLLSRDAVFSEMKILFRRADFFRWVYFNLRDELRADTEDESFSWDLLLERAEEEQTTEDGFILEAITTSSKANQIELEVAFYSNQMSAKEEDYFNALLGIEDMLSATLPQLGLNLSGTNISCLTLKLNSTAEWNECIENYFNHLSFQEDIKTNWENALNQKVKELVASALSLKDYFESQ